MITNLYCACGCKTRTGMVNGPPQKSNLYGMVGLHKDPRIIDADYLKRRAAGSFIVETVKAQLFPREIK